ncbi:integrin beta-1-like [Anneissia japonica]|uniref:integrin beta-1-like n=1 Tax=Anneissia japonica TaxID=1529436 RepID=UPI0014254B97|nr:integrin beta-1-like [Anneissia japonica]XP_033097333.1 integrin beta-1-like [Anneissia japonica]
MKSLWLRLAILCIVILSVFLDVTQGIKCTAAKSCGDCMVQSAECAWCKSTTISSNKCDVPESLIAKGCPKEDIVQPKSGLTIIKDVELSNAGDAAVGEAVQVKPQQIELELRPGDTYQVEVNIRQAEDYPLDLYYVMDVSSSMIDDLATVGKLGNDLASTMANITRDFRLGFGAFVDKVVMPYVDLTKLNNPCEGTTLLDKKCQPPFSFQNALSLTNQTNLFQEAVSDLQPSGSLDYPEGGLDALMQAASCQDIIGWRERARHLLFYTTNSAFHIAGDGKLGGIVKANDGKCHTNPVTGYYTMQDQLDYPSVSQLSQVLEANSILPVFAVTSDVIAQYEKLPAFFHEAEVTEISEDSSNVVDVIKAIYDSITSKVEMDDNITGDLKDFISVNYTSFCYASLTGKPNSKECEGLALGDTISFSLNITVNKTLCDEEKKSRSFKVGPVSFVEKLDILVKAICDCDCEQNKEPVSPKCTDGNGTFVCGGCVCNKGRSGAFCECDQEESEEIDPKCVKKGDEAPCSSRGQCNCGLCICRDTTPPRLVQGDYCECDTNDCIDPNSNKICAGSGKCLCTPNVKSICVCDEGFTGEFCDCSMSNYSCIAPNGELCNGKGQCDCGKCDCIDGFDGKTCECGDECESECEANQACVKCEFEEGEYFVNGQCDEKCKMKYRKVKVLEDTVGNARKCKYTDENQCVVTYTQEILPDGTLELIIKEDPECYGGPDVLWIIIGIIIGIILVGLALLLIWRLLTFIHDKREFEQFEKERQEAKWEGGHNPLYKPSTSTFKNPMYAAKQNS